MSKSYDGHRALLTRNRTTGSGTELSLLLGLAQGVFCLAMGHMYLGLSFRMVYKCICLAGVDIASVVGLCVPSYKLVTVSKQGVYVSVQLLADIAVSGSVG